MLPQLFVTQACPGSAGLRIVDRGSASLTVYFSLTKTLEEGSRGLCLQLESNYLDILVAAVAFPKP